MQIGYPRMKQKILSFSSLERNKNNPKKQHRISKRGDIIKYWFMEFNN